MTNIKVVRLKSFYNKMYKDILRRAIIFFLFGAFIIVILKNYRFNLILYIFAFLISFSVSTFMFFMKPDKPKEFVESDK